MIKKGKSFVVGKNNFFRKIKRLIGNFRTKSGSKIKFGNFKFNKFENN